MRDSDVEAVILRYYAEGHLRIMDANTLLRAGFRQYPNLKKIVIEEMTSQERALAGVVAEHGIIDVRSRYFIYAVGGTETSRAELLEKEVEFHSA